MPSIAMSTASAPDARAGASAAPTAWTMRPQLGSPPCRAVLTSGELATARATASTARRWSPPDDARGRSAAAPSPSATSMIASGAAARRAPRRSAARPRSRARPCTPLAPRAHQDRGVVGGELTVDGDAVEGALARIRRAAASAVSGASAASVCTKHSIVAKRGEIMPAPLHWALRPHRRPTAARPPGRRASRTRRSSGSPAGSRRRRRRRSSSRACGHARAAIGVHGEVAGRSRRSRRARPRRDQPTAASAAAPCVVAASVEPALAGGGVGAAGVGEHGAQRVRGGSARA